MTKAQAINDKQHATSPLLDVFFTIPETCLDPVYWTTAVTPSILEAFKNHCQWLEDLPIEQTSGNGNFGHHRALAKVDPSVLHNRGFESRAMCPRMQNEPTSTCLWASGTTSRLVATFSLLCRLLPFGTTSALPVFCPCSRKAIAYAHKATALEQLDPRSHPCSHNAEALASGSARASIIHSALTWLVELRDLLELLEGGGAKGALSLAVLRLSLRRGHTQSTEQQGPGK